VSGAVNVAAYDVTQDAAMLEGVLHVIWGDPYAGEGQPRVVYSLHDDLGVSHALSADPNANINLGAYNRLRVRVYSAESQPAVAATGVFMVSSIEIVGSATQLAGEVTAALAGAQDFLNIQLRWPGTTTDPVTAAWINTMMGGAAWPSINHFYRQASFNNIWITSTTVGPYTMPHSASWYTTNYPTNYQYLDVIFDDAVGLADSAAYYPNYDGINLLFNDEIDGYAWGGGSSTTLDGGWSGPVTWEPPWGYTDDPSGGLAVMAHEIGHGFGLQHSGDAVGGWNGHGREYSSCWDVMSWGGRSPCANAHYHTSYSYLPTHMIADYKDELGWIPSNRKLTTASSYSVQLFPLDTLSLAAGNYMMIKIPITGSRYYTVELRRRPNPSVTSASYDNFLPGRAVIIHDVDPTRSDQKAMVVDIDSDGDPNDSGAQFLFDNAFRNVADTVRVTVLGDGPSGSIYLKIDDWSLNYIAVRGSDNKSYHDWPPPSYDKYWKAAPTGSTLDGPAIVRCGSLLHFVVRGGSNVLYYANLNVDTGAFTSWSSLNGESPSAPAVTKDPTNCALYAVVRGMDNRIYFKTRSSGGTWAASWTVIPTGSTPSAPAAAYRAEDQALHMAVRGSSGNTIYYGKWTVPSSTWSGWTQLSGATPSGPALATIPGGTGLLLVVRGTDNKLYYKTWSPTTGWSPLLNWQVVPTGSTNNQPAVTVLGSNQAVIAVRGTDGKVYFAISDSPYLSWTTWRALPGSTPSSPSICKT